MDNAVRQWSRLELDVTIWAWVKLIAIAVAIAIAMDAVVVGAAWLVAHY
jgi:hypothetical protein